MYRLLLIVVFVMNSPLLLAQCMVSVSSPQAANCGLCNGAVEVTFYGGIPPYAVNYNGMPYGSISGAPLLIPNACAGPLMVSVTDGNNVLCTGMLNGIVSGSTAPPLALQFSQTNPSCPYCFDGIIQAMVVGGTPPYAYNWSNGNTAATQSNLQQGIFFLNVTDAAGCSIYDTVFLGSNLNNLAYLSGRIYVDSDNNQQFTPGDSPVAYQQVECQPSGIIAYSNAQGEYFFPENPGNHTVQYIVTPLYSVNNGTGTYSVTLGNNSITGLDFPLQVDSLVRSPQVYTACPLPRCNTIVPFYTTLLNRGTDTDSGEVRIHFDPAMVPVSTQPPASVIGNTIVFGYSSLLPSQSRQFVANFQLPGPGSVLQLSSEAHSIGVNGSILAGDTLPLTIPVVCAFDPNDKRVFPEGDGPSHRVDMDQELQYLLRFQNTGNDTAFNILITDTLAGGLEPESVELISSSHDCWMQRANGNVLRFHFTNIQLPDSNVNEAESHGYVMFRCLGKTNNADPTTVSNRAAIYFDANPPVITNSTLSTFSNLSTGLSSVVSGGLLLQVTPQPFRENCTIKVMDPKNEAVYRYRIIDVSGKTVFGSGIFNGQEVVLQRNGLVSGLYLLEISDIKDGRTAVISLLAQ